MFMIYYTDSTVYFYFYAGATLVANAYYFASISIICRMPTSLAAAMLLTAKQYCHYFVR